MGVYVLHTFLRVLGQSFSRFTVAFFILLLGLSNASGQQPMSTDDLPTAVEPPQRPTEVSIAAYLIGLSGVSEPSSAFPTFDVEMYIELSWKDPRLAFSTHEIDVLVFQEEEAAEKLSEIWSPDPEIQNEIEQRQTESIELRIFPDGLIKYEERFSATLHAELALARFPFDTQTLGVEFQSFLWDIGDSVFVSNEERTGFDPDFRTPEWLVKGTSASVDQRFEIRDDRAFSTYTFQIVADRQAGHYVMRFLLPLIFVMALTWSAFWMPAGPRIRVGFVALLTVVASHTVISGNLPRLNYPTFADIVLLVCYLYVAVLIVVSLKVQHLEERDEEGSDELAQRINSLTCRALPVAAVLALGSAVLILWF